MGKPRRFARDKYDHFALRSHLQSLGISLRSATEPIDDTSLSDGIAFDGNRFVGTGATAPAFSYLREIRTENEGLVAQIFTSWNPLTSWMRKIEGYRSAA